VRRVSAGSRGPRDAARQPSVPSGAGRPLPRRGLTVSLSHAAGRGGVRARGRLKGLKVTPSCGEESWHLREQAASRQRARKQEPSRSDKQRTQADSPRGSESSERVRSARPLLHRKSPGVGEVSWSLRFLFGKSCSTRRLLWGSKCRLRAPRTPRLLPQRTADRITGGRVRRLLW
jgi:hypothetical protein